jgi:hypothetical protein
MSNPDLTGNMKSLPDALRALPQVAPERGVWPELAAQLCREARARDGGSRIAIRKSPAAPLVRRWFVPAALAAGVVLAAVAWPLLRREPPAPAAVAATDSPAAASIPANAANNANATSAQSAELPQASAAQLASLHRRSQALEHWLRETQRAAAPLSGQDLAAAAEIEDMIALVDGQLNAAPPDSELPLWRRRVALLEDLTALRYSSYRLAENGVALR